MDEIWAKLYAAAKAVQQERQISDYVLAGGVAAAVLSKSGKIYTVIAGTAFFANLLHAGHLCRAKRHFQHDYQR